jgi:hypothetical protein
MKSTAAAAGGISGCVVWLVVLAVLLTCLAPAAFGFALITTTSNLAASVVGPLVCPAGSTAYIERAPTTFVDDQGFTREAMGAEMVCADSAGTVVARPAPLPNWIWTGLVCGAGLAIGAVLALALAAPAGVVVGRVVGRRQKKAPTALP